MAEPVGQPAAKAAGWIHGLKANVRVNFVASGARDREEAKRIRGLAA